MLGICVMAIGLGCLALTCCAETPAQSSPPDQVQVLFPPNRSVLLVGTFEVIAKGPPVELRVDGKLRAWDNYQPPLQVAKVGFPPGMHEIRVGQQRIEFSVALSEEDHEGPRNWPIVLRHAISNDRSCGGCHETAVTDGRIALKGLRDSTACFECHLKEHFDAQHARVSPPLEQCASCHALHGSHEKALLKAPAK